MKLKGLTITCVVKSFTINYDEGYGNVSVVKKVHRGNGETYIFASRQSLRYSLTEWCFQHLGWKRGVVKPQGEGSKKVIQYDLEELKKCYFEEADLFGYMITSGKGNKAYVRSAVAKITHLISLEPYHGDQELLNNLGFAQRCNEDPNLANIETAYSYYKYTLTIDLDRVGEDNIEGIRISLPVQEKIKRVTDLLEAIKFLYRDIRGRREDLHPLFVIGGIYHIKSPFFHNAINIEWKGTRPYLNRDSIEQVLKGEYYFDSQVYKIMDNTCIGIQAGEFGNSLEIKKSPFEAIDEIKNKVREVYVNKR